jgi:hypothetical protein
LETKTRAVDSVAPTSLDPLGVAAFIAAVLVPGAGHVVVGKYRRALLLSLMIFATFGLGLILKGKVYSYNDTALSIFYTFADLGAGLLTTMICLAGLLNYLVALDAYDIAVGRKN